MATQYSISCKELVEIVTDYLEGALSPAERSRFEAHIDACDGCSSYLEQMRKTIRMMGKLTEDAVRPDAKAALVAAFRTWKRDTPA